jgi:hypothetical protein
MPAGVGLMGVDSTLGQIATLPGPDAYGRVTVRVTADRPAFDSFDPKALVLGQVRGENAAKAAVLRISQLPADAAGDERLWGSVRTTDDDLEVLTRNFYRALEALYVEEHAWEASAPAGEMMTPEKMVELWDKVVSASPSEDPYVDAFGRPLGVKALPQDLLAQVDPRTVVTDGTRLPEDIVSWQRYVEEEVQ